MIWDHADPHFRTSNVRLGAAPIRLKIARAAAEGSGRGKRRHLANLIKTPPG